MIHINALWQALQKFVANQFPPLPDYPFAGTGGYLW
jgi:hypothetical protein